MPSRILIIGSGFAGLYSALSARRLLSLHSERSPTADDIEVAVIAPEPRLVVTPRLYLADPGSMAAPLGDLFQATGIRFIQGHVDKITTDDKTVHVLAADGTHFSVDFDRLILTAGSRLVHPAIPGLEEHGFAVHDMDKALKLEAHLRGLGSASPGPARNTVVVCGGGFTGIEVAAELPARLRNILGQDADVRVVVVERSQDIGPELGAGPRPVIIEAFEALSVEMRLGVTVAAVDSDGVVLSTGERIQASTVVWTAGVQASLLADQIPGDKDNVGRLVVDQYLRIIGTRDVFAAGDTARAATDQNGNVAMMSCQHAVPLGRIAGNNAAADLLGIDPTAYSQPFYVTCLALGSYGAVATVGWERRVVLAGPKVKPLKQYVNRVLIHPPKANRVEAFAAADPGYMYPEYPILPFPAC